MKPPARRQKKVSQVSKSSFTQDLRRNFSSTLQKLATRLARKDRISQRVRLDLYRQLSHAAEVIVYARTHRSALRQIKGHARIAKLRKKPDPNDVSRMVMIILYRAEDRVSRDRATRHARAIDELLEQGCAFQNIPAEMAGLHGIAGVSRRASTTAITRTSKLEEVGGSSVRRKPTRSALADNGGSSHAVNAGRARTPDIVGVPSPKKGKVYAFLEVTEKLLARLQRPGQHDLSFTSTRTASGWVRMEAETTKAAAGVRAKKR